MKDTIKKIVGLDAEKLFWIIMAAFITGLIPILYLSGYVHATGDDYGYGILGLMRYGWRQVGLQTLVRAAETSVDYWYSWQGTWFTIFLMALQPEVFSPGGYWIVPWVMLGITIVSTSVVTYYFLVKKLELKTGIWACINLLLLFVMIQYFPSTKSGIFWWNGTVHYIIPYGLAMMAVYVDVPVSRYGKKTLFYICLYQYVLSGRFQLSGTAVCVNCFRIYGYFSEK